MDRFFLALLVFVPISIIASFTGISPVAVFFLCAVAIVPLSKFIGESVEEIASHTSPALGGILSATFGNATELIIGIFALRAGLFEVVKASIAGSIIGNLLLVLGMAMLVGGWKRTHQTFNRTAALAAGSTLFIAVIALIVPALFAQTAPHASISLINSLSVAIAVILLCIYGASLLFSLRTHKHLYTEEVGKYEPRWSVGKSTLILLAATLAVSWVSEILVGSIQPLVASFGWTQLFIGVILIAVIGNAAEHTSAVTIAMKNRMDLSLQIAIGSATQIAMVVAPVLVLISFFMTTPMNLVFGIFELVAVTLSVLVVNLVVLDGESNWFEGLQLLSAYAIVAVAFFFYS